MGGGKIVLRTCVLQDSITEWCKRETWIPEDELLPLDQWQWQHRHYSPSAQKQNLLLSSCCSSLLGAASSGSCHCPSLQDRRCRWDRAPQTAYGKLLSSSPGHLSINGILLIPLSFVLKSLGLPRHWLINYEMVLRALVRCATVLDHSFL